jgi:hypothetical protein
MSAESAAQIEAFKAITVHTRVKSVLRVLQGEDVKVVANDVGVSPERLVRWKERFIEGGRANLMQRRTDVIARSQKRRQKHVQWTVLVVGLMLLIWVMTRVFASMVQRGG